MLQSSLPFAQILFLSLLLLLFCLLFFLDLHSCLAAEGGMNAAEYGAPLPDTWAHGFMSREPALVNAYTRTGYLSGLLSSLAEVGTLAFLH